METFLKKIGMAEIFVNVFHIKLWKWGNENSSKCEKHEKSFSGKRGETCKGSRLISYLILEQFYFVPF